MIGVSDLYIRKYSVEEYTNELMQTIYLKYLNTPLMFHIAVVMEMFKVLLEELSKVSVFMMYIYRSNHSLRFLDRHTDL